MAENIKCEWCNNYGGYSFTRTQNKKKQYSKQKFCSLKCKTEFQDRRAIEWIDEKSNSLFIVIAVIIVIYFLIRS